MKGFFLSLLVVVFLLLPVKVFAGNELLWEKQLPFKDATIHYVIKGMEEGKETLYVRENGKERATYRETVSNMMGMKMTNSTITIKNPDYIYSYDLQKQEGFKAVNPQKYMIEEYNKLSRAEQERVREGAKKMGAAYTEGMGGAMQPNALEILGYSCDKVEIMDGSATYLIHDTDVTLKTEMNIMGMNLTMVAESVDKAKVDDTFFQHPQGITAEVNSQSDEIAKNMATQAIAMLKDPESTKNTQVMAPKTVPGGKKQMSREEKEEMMQQMEQMMKGLQEKAAQ
ncbi:MAG: hypothetical protein KJ630_03860 [Proteobacteria bacterium]|nr:hypothetical protein [Pseudomonadota bacterium]